MVDDYVMEQGLYEVPIDIAVNLNMMLDESCMEYLAHASVGEEGDNIKRSMRSRLF